MSNSRILIIGCGYVGSALGASLARQGHRVWGLRRTEAQPGSMEAKGITPLIADVSDLRPGMRLPKADAVVVALAPGAGDTYRSTYLDSARRLPALLAPMAPQRVVWVSSTGIYGQSDGSWVDETTPPELNTERARLLYESEQCLIKSELRATVLRFGGIYGPGRDRLRLLQNGRARLDPSAYINNIHLADCVGMLQFLLDHGHPGELYLGVDDAPAVKADFYRWLAERSGVSILASEGASGRAGSNKRCSNGKIKAMGYRLRYPDYKLGYASILNQGKGGPALK